MLSLVRVLSVKCKICKCSLTLMASASSSSEVAWKNTIDKHGFKGPYTPLAEIVEWLGKYGAGSVSLSKNSESGIARVEINQPAKKNSFSGKMMVDLYHVVEDLEQWDDGKGVILSGAEGTFCSGGDLDVVRQISDPESGFKMATLMHHSLNKLKSLPLISVCFIDGAGAIGGGAEISTACDYRLMADNTRTKIGFVHGKMGLAPAWGGLRRLVNIVGKHQALDLLLTATLLNSQDAMKIKLIDGHADSVESAERWLLEKIKFDRVPVRAMKLTLGALDECDDSLTELEQRLFAPTWGCDANKEMLQKAVKHK